MAELEVENLSLRFGGLTVLEGVSFAVEPAELFALIGPNGAGKTVRRPFRLVAKQLIFHHQNNARRVEMDIDNIRQ
jgi:ABC-type branched-subunit amino acid transport system ATPase component